MAKITFTPPRLKDEPQKPENKVVFKGVMKAVQSSPLQVRFDLIRTLGDLVLNIPNITLYTGRGVDAGDLLKKSFTVTITEN